MAESAAALGLADDQEADEGERGAPISAGRGRKKDPPNFGTPAPEVYGCPEPCPTVGGVDPRQITPQLIMLGVITAIITPKSPFMQECRRFPDGPMSRSALDRNCRLMADYPAGQSAMVGKTDRSCSRKP